MAQFRTVKIEPTITVEADNPDEAAQKVLDWLRLLCPPEVDGDSVIDFYAPDDEGYSVEFEDGSVGLAH